MTSTTIPRSRRRLLLAGTALSLALVAGACGDDDDSASATSAAAGAGGAAAAGGDGGVDAYCAASAEIDGAFANVDETTDLSAFAPMIANVVALAPAEVHHHALAMGEAFEQAAGDESGFESPEVQEANDALHAYELDNCGWEQVDLRLVDYEFADVPDEVAAGVTSFELANEGKEPHVMVVVRRAEGVTDAWEDLLAMPEEESMSKIEMMGSTFVPPGGSDSLVLDLEPGEYLLVCPIPTGTTGEAEGTGPPHFVHGMSAELNVA